MISADGKRHSPLVLVVDDDANSRLLTRAALEPHGFLVAEAADGAAAIALCQEDRPDLVLLDVLMPEMDGYETCAALRRLPEGDLLAIVMMTGLEDIDSITRAFQTGANDFITKPINWTLLYFRVQYLLMASRALLQRKYLEEQLHQSQKMEAIGRLAGGVAHDFNNLLTVISGCSDLLLARLPYQDPCRIEIEEIRQAAEQASSLTRQLLAFSRKQILQPQVLDLNQLVIRMEKMLRRIIGEDIEVVTALVEDPVMVQADPGQLEQVVLNLAINARDAMPQGGRLTLKVDRVTLDETFCQWHPEAHPGPFVVLTVCDTGVGMDEITMAKAFEPFFTTKETGKGTGLGLAMVHGVVKQSGGFIRLASKPGRGTSMEVYLPLASHEMAQEEQTLAVKGDLRGEETILLVEDDPLVRRVAGKILKTYGYEILEAENGLDALHLGHCHPCPIDLLLTDIIMPDMNGRDLAERWKIIHPESQILYTSGYNENVIAQHGTLEPGISFIPKPYRMTTLAQKVREVLNRPLQRREPISS
jgi:two-component system cell cycle sensor histidine kinase/response regulator CckA